LLVGTATATRDRDKHETNETQSTIEHPT